VGLTEGGRPATIAGAAGAGTTASARVTGRSEGDVADRLALRDLVDAYAVAVDARDDELFVSLFTPDAKVIVHRSGMAEPVATFDGAAALPKLVGALAARYAVTFHLVGNHRSVVTGDTAVGETYCVAHHIFLDPEGEPPGVPTDLRMPVRYADRYQRGADGVWRFTRRAVTSMWTSRHPVADSGLPDPT
jgi:hypothetical protein